MWQLNNREHLKFLTYMLPSVVTFTSRIFRRQKDRRIFSRQHPPSQPNKPCPYSRLKSDVPHAKKLSGSHLKCYRLIIICANNVYLSVCSFSEDKLYYLEWDEFYKCVRRLIAWCIACVSLGRTCWWKKTNWKKNMKFVKRSQGSFFFLNGNTNLETGSLLPTPNIGIYKI